jgi:hypothetical protein
MTDALDNFYSAPVPPDQQKTAVKAAAAAAQKTSDTFVIERSGLNVVANGVYAFSFAYTYSDPGNPSNKLLSLPSANFRFTLEAPDYTVPVQNLTVTPGTLSYIAKWDPIDKSLAANKWFIDAQIYESTTGAFAGEEYLVWNGTGNTATILVSDLSNRWIRVDTRDQDYHKKSVVRGPFKATDPIIVDTTGPGNVTSVTTVASGIDTSGYMGFNGYATIQWSAVTGNGIRGYRIRFSNDNNATYSYVDSPGTGTTYKLTGLAVGATYKIAVATYDEYNNTSLSYISGPDVTISGVPAIINYITAGPFQFGVGVGSVSTNKGLYFDASNYWLVNATNSARLKVGGITSNYLEWNGTKLAIDGDITARGGSFSGNILMTTNAASIYSGTINTTTGALTGDGFALNSSGLKVAKGSNSITLDAATGTITANAGTISGWTMSGTTLSKNNVILDSAGKIQVGAAANTSVYIQSVAGTSPTKTYVMWAGNNIPDSNAKFKVAADGTLYATGAIFGNGTTVPGYATSVDLGATNTNVTSLSTTVTNQGTTLSTKLTKSAAVITNASNQIQGLNANGITMFSNNNASASVIPTSGARVVMNSRGIVGYDGNSINEETGITFSIGASTGSAYFKGQIAAGSGSIGGWTISPDGWLTGYGATLGGTNFALATDSTKGISSGRFSATDDTTQSIFRGGAIIGPVGSSMNVSTNGQVTISSSSPGAFFYADTIIGATSSNTLTVNAKATFGSDLITEGANNANTLTPSPNVYMTSAGVIRKTSGSSLRYKKDVVDLLSVENLNPIKLYDLPVRAFKFKEEFLGDDDSRYDKLIPGFIAEEVEQIYPIAADYDDDGVEKWNVQVIIPAMLALIQSLNSRLDALEG